MNFHVPQKRADVVPEIGDGRPHCRGLYVGGDDVLESSRNEIVDRDPLAGDIDVPVKEIVVRRDARPL